MASYMTLDLGTGRMVSVLMSAQEQKGHDAIVSAPDNIDQPDPIIEGLDLIDSMFAVIDYDTDSALAEAMSVVQAQSGLIRMLRGG